MIRYTTPTIQLVVNGIDLTEYDVYVTLEQADKKITKSDADLTITTETVEEVTNTKIQFTLSQEESASFKSNAGVSIQANWIHAGTRGATEMKQIDAYRNLLDEVIE